MSDDRTLPVTPAERTAAAMLRAWQAWEPDVTDPEPVRRMLVMFGAGAAAAGLFYGGTDVLTPAGRELLARAEAAERTPKTTLRAMLADYNEAAITAAGQFLANGSDRDAAFKRQRRLLEDIAEIHMVIARGSSSSSFILSRLRADFEARLAGTVPIDAPPRREP